MANMFATKSACPCGFAETSDSAQWQTDAPSTMPPTDMSGPVYRVRGNGLVDEVLLAVPWILVVPKASDGADGFELSVEIRRNSGDLLAIKPYDSSVSSLQDATVASIDAQIFPISRLGARVRLPAGENADDARQGIVRFRIEAAITAILTSLGRMIVDGSGAGKPAQFKGLAALCAENGTTAQSTGDVDADAAEALLRIATRSGGGADGPHCLLGSQRVLRRLMASPVGRSGSSGWKRDLRTGRVVFHYHGLPFYRVADDLSKSGRLYAANLGPNGLQLLHTEATRDSFGLAFTDTPPQSPPGIREVSISAGYALLLPDRHSLFEVTKIES